MKRNFMPGMILLTGSIEPGDSTGVIIGGDQGEVGDMAHDANGTLYIFDGEDWVDLEGNIYTGDPGDLIPGAP